MAAEKPKRLIVISDLHLGGRDRSMMSHPGSLAEFIGKTVPQFKTQDEALELVLAGDVVDFLALAEGSAWTPDQNAAVRKLETLFVDPWNQVFQALRRYLGEGGGRLTILVGNHDLELALPAVQAKLLEYVATEDGQVTFLADGRALSLGDVLVEHGNRYDGANQNDWTGLRAIVSALSRNEEPESELIVSSGSRIVEKVVNKLKPSYPFVDLLEPQGLLTLILLLEFEPQLAHDLTKLAALLRGRIEQRMAKQGLQPGRTRNVSDEDFSDESDPEFRALFGDRYLALQSGTEQVGVWSQLAVRFREGHRQSLRAELSKGTVSRKRLRRIRYLLKRTLDSEAAAELRDPLGPCGAAAERLTGLGAKLVIMGHTHRARDVSFGPQASYLNTGSWTDTIQIPQGALVDEDLDELSGFLHRLVEDQGVRQLKAHFADVRLSENNELRSAELVSVQ